MSALPTYLVASATANTGQGALRALVESGKVKVRAMTRNVDSDKAKALGALANVELVAGDFDDAASVAKALEGVSRAFLVTAAGTPAQADREIAFLDAAKAAGVVTVRVSTYSALVGPDESMVYPFAHYTIENYIKEHGLKVVSLSPNWFMTNVLGSAAEAKATGKMSFAAPGAAKTAMIHPSDVGAAGAAILLQDDIERFVKIGLVEVNGPAEVSFDEQAAALSAAAGKPIEFVKVSAEAAVAALSPALGEVFAKTFVHTIQTVGGEVPPAKPVQPSTPELLEIWQPKITVEDLAKEIGPLFK